MMPRYTLPILILLTSSLQVLAQPTVKSLKDDRQIPLFSITGRTLTLEKGVQIEITRLSGTRVQSTAFQLADSLAYIIDLRSFLDKIRLADIQQHMDTLVADYRLRVANLEQRLELYDAQLRLEQKTLDSLRVLSAVKDQIVGDAIDTINSYRRRGLFLGAVLGFAGGALWARKEDANFWKVAKPIGGAGLGFFWSFTVFK